MAFLKKILIVYKKTVQSLSWNKVLIKVLNKVMQRY